MLKKQAARDLVAKKNAENIKKMQERKLEEEKKTKDEEEKK